MELLINAIITGVAGVLLVGIAGAITAIVFYMMGEWDYEIWNINEFIYNNRTKCINKVYVYLYLGYFMWLFYKRKIRRKWYGTKEEIN